MPSKTRSVLFQKSNSVIMAGGFAAVSRQISWILDIMDIWSPAKKVSLRKYLTAHTIMSFWGIVLFQQNCGNRAESDVRKKLAKTGNYHIQLTSQDWPLKHTVFSAHVRRAYGFWTLPLRSRELWVCLRKSGWLSFQSRISIEITRKIKQTGTVRRAWAVHCNPATGNAFSIWTLIR